MTEPAAAPAPERTLLETRSDYPRGFGRRFLPIAIAFRQRRLAPQV